MNQKKSKYGKEEILDKRCLLGSYSFTSPLTKERINKIEQFMKKTDCLLAESINFLWFLNWDLKLAVATHVLCKMSRLKTKTFEKNQQLDRSHSSVQRKQKNLYDRKRLLAQTKSVSCPNVVKAFQFNEKKKRRKQKYKTNVKRALSLREIQDNSTNDKEAMKRFLTQKPAPRWKARLTAFDDYDSNLIRGWPFCLKEFNGMDENKKRIRKLIIHKKLFQIYLLLNPSVSIKNLQRGLITFMEKQNFLNLSKYDDPVYLFVSYEAPTF
ncbi:hypothetical protein M0812_09181 [Anaeramoeba flamelloides]|uniref:Uncharacterized protein n=1 Tax=Anaeramoeba flamelloides TaxID=1746091 RepID=A0AAV7ZQF1_9EUKA|nr:hypothetical protein M0812_09181 [Anaeramoeba flamelloides]